MLRVAKNELAVRPAIVRSEKPNTGPKDWFSGIDDETWLWMNTTGRRRHKAIARLLPEMPEASIQEGFTGSSGDSTLGEGFRAYQLFKKCYETHVGPIESCCACYECYGEEGGRSFWGEACISKSYVERRWREIFDVCDYIDDRGACAQNVIAARKRA